MTRGMSVSRPRILPAGFIEPCIPTVASVPPTGPGWVHEIKHDGYRLVARLEGSRVRLFTRRGHEWLVRQISSHRRSPGESESDFRND
jgi:ATP-dependent DNA ligase